MRAVLIVNPTATTTSSRRRDVLVSALGAHVELTVHHTTGRGHAATLAHEATDAGVELVVCLSGDGTINEVVNGILSAPASSRTATPATMLGIVPGGSTNVLCRALGLPRDPIEATGALLEAVRRNQSRVIGLGKVDDRWFTFCAGVGFDAEVVRHVELRRRGGKRCTAALYARVAAVEYARRHHSAQRQLTLIDDQAHRHRLAMAVVQNTSPWTYVGNRPIHGSPTASFDTGLDVLGLASLTPGVLMRSMIGVLGSEGPVGPGVMTLHDANTLCIHADRPVAVHVDGDFIGERETVTFTAAPAALRVAVPSGQGHEQGADSVSHAELL